MGACDLQAQCLPLKRGRPDLPWTYKAESFRSGCLECHLHGGRVLNVQRHWTASCCLGVERPTRTKMTTQRGIKCGRGWGGDRAVPVSRCHCLGDPHGLGPQSVLDLSEAGSRGEPLHRSPCFPMGLTPCVFQGFFGFVVGLCRALPLRLGAKAWKFALLALTETLASVLFPRVSIELVAFSGNSVEGSGRTLIPTALFSLCPMKTCCWAQGVPARCSQA